MSHQEESLFPYLESTLTIDHNHSFSSLTNTVHWQSLISAYDPDSKLLRPVAFSSKRKKSEQNINSFDFYKTEVQISNRGTMEVT
jgi:hypothetical protein